MCGIVLTRRVLLWKVTQQKKWSSVAQIIPLHEGRLRGRGRKCQKTFVDKDYSLVSEAHFSVLQQLIIAEPYIDEQRCWLLTHQAM
jgi:hypothetical protein